jgi:hypothetical protein
VRNGNDGKGGKGSTYRRQLQRRGGKGMGGGKGMFGGKGVFGRKGMIGGKGMGGGKGTFGGKGMFGGKGKGMVGGKGKGMVGGKGKGGYTDYPKKIICLPPPYCRIVPPGPCALSVSGRWNRVQCALIKPISH